MTNLLHMLKSTLVKVPSSKMRFTLARALSLGLFLLLVIHGSNPAGAAVTSRTLDSSATLTEVHPVFAIRNPL